MLSRGPQLFVSDSTKCCVKKIIYYIAYAQLAHFRCNIYNAINKKKSAVSLKHVSFY